MSETLVTVFKKERACKHSVRYISTDKVGKSIASTIYLKNEALEKLGNPEEISLTLKAK